MFSIVQTLFELTYYLCNRVSNLSLVLAIVIRTFEPGLFKVNFFQFNLFKCVFINIQNLLFICIVNGNFHEIIQC